AAPVAPGASIYGLRVARPGLLADVDNRVIQVSHDGGRSWQRATLPIPTGSGISALAFGDARHGLAAEEGFGCLKGGGVIASHLFATDDGGVSWQSLPTPAFAVGYRLDAVPGLAAAIAEGAACGDYWLALSRDGGRSWTLTALPHGLDCTPSVAAPATVWLTCGRTLFTSSDGGATWTQLTGRLAIDAAAPTPTDKDG
ncbi:MAG: WD40/YVTN/BNR-like repeat-containing protein, partial [Gaiellaceae bacterium]